jgi:protein-tyrosine phosphatase
MPMTTAEPFVDIHCHVLPGIDDGAKSLDEALAMAEMAVADGIEAIVATPHQLGSHAKNTGEAIRAAAAAFQRVLKQKHIPLRVVPGADVRIEPDLPRKIRTGEVVTLGDRGRHVLLELPHDVYVPLDRLLAELAAARLVGVLSHPERNHGILSQPGVLRPLVERGCLLQVTAASLLGTFGSQPEKLATSLIEQGLVHFVSTDAHSTHGRPPKLRAAFDRIVELVGEEVARDVCCRHPAAVADGSDVTPGCRRPTRRTWTGWLCRTFSSESVAAEPIE